MYRTKEGINLCLWINWKNGNAFQWSKRKRKLVRFFLVYRLFINFSFFLFMFSVWKISLSLPNGNWKYPVLHAFFFSSLFLRQEYKTVPTCFLPVSAWLHIYLWKKGYWVSQSLWVIKQRMNVIFFVKCCIKNVLSEWMCVNDYMIVIKESIHVNGGRGD